MMMMMMMMMKLVCVRLAHTKCRTLKGYAAFVVTAPIHGKALRRMVGRKHFMVS